jgi:putative thioredoxin
MNIYDVTEADFEELVIEESKKRPVVIDFWSPMCGPCKVLTPILDKIVEEMNGKAALAKVKVDDNQRLAAAFGVQGVPAVKVIKDAKLVTEFVGARPEPEVRAILESVVPSKADELTEQGAQKQKAGDLDGAEALYTQALSAKPGHGGATMGLAYVAIERGDKDEARRLASSIEPGTKEKQLADALLARLELSGECPSAEDAAAIAEKVKANPDDLDARYEYAQCLAAAGQYQDALENLLGVIERNKAYKDGAAKNLMVKIFGIVGKRSELADTYRDRLANLLY